MYVMPVSGQPLLIVIIAACNIFASVDLPFRSSMVKVDLEGVRCSGGRPYFALADAGATEGSLGKGRCRLWGDWIDSHS